MFRPSETHSERRRKRCGAAVLALLAALALGPSALAADAPPRVVATVGMIGDVAATLGGSCVEVVTLMGPGIDPHLYAATSGDVRELDRADLILYAGLSLEGQLGDVLDRFGERTPTLAVAQAGVPEADRIRTDDAYGVDPHVWMDVSAWAGTVAPIAARLARIAPACEEDIARRADAYEARLAALHDWVGRAIATIPPEHRVLVTAHDAFAYFGRAYGIDVVGIQGVSTESEAGIADIRAVARGIADAGVPAVFVETTIHPRTIRAVLDAAADLGADAREGGALYADAMGDAGTADGTYIGMIRANTVTVVEALGGEPPPLPDELADWAARHGVAAR